MQKQQDAPSRALRAAEQQQPSEELPAVVESQIGTPKEDAPSAEPQAVASPACAQDLAAYCQREAKVLALLREAPDVVEPRRIVDAVRQVHLCMVTHADVLSVDCVDSLSADAAMPTPTTVAASVPAAKKMAALGRDADVDDDSSMEINIYYSRHHNGAGHALRSGGALAANHVQAAGPATTMTDVLAHPLTWVCVLPFFVIGLYVSFTRAATFMRRRREERRIESKQYMPVN